VQHAEEEFEGNNGTRLFGQSWVPQGRKKATLIIVHGLHDHSTRYAWAAEELAKKGYAVYGFDLRGHGRSSGTREWIESSDDYLEDLGRFVKLVQAKEVGRPLFLFGFSLGGAIVASYVLRNSEGISGVILASAALKSTVSGVTKAVSKVLGTLFPRLGAFRIASKDFSRDPEVVLKRDEDPLISKKKVPARIALWILRSIERLQAEAGEFDTPILLLQGTGDKIVPPEGSKIFYERVRSADKTLKLYDGAYHELLYEPEKQAVLDDISDWLGKRS
jgi:alpha-beta hydrolase superfamily lysophospholipase